MKKWIAIVVLCCIPMSLFGAEQAVQAKQNDLSNRWYFGGGFNYNIENFSGDLSENIDWDNTWGMDVKAGYFFTDYFALEAMFQYLHEFKWEETTREYTYIYPYWYYYDVDWKATVTGYTFTLNGKGFIPLDSNFRPYGVLGIGYARGEAELSASYLGVTVKETDTESDMCGRVGAGLDVFLAERFAIEGEVAYNMGFGDLDNLKYTSLALNGLVLF